MDYLLQALFACPRCWRFVGRLVFAVCTGLALLGLRLALRTGRVEERTGIHIDLSQALDALPIPVPTTANEFALTLFCAGLGFSLARLGRWAEHV